MGIIVDGMEGQRRVESLAGLALVFARAYQPADLGREQIVGSRALAQAIAYPPLAQTVAIEGRRIEIAAAFRPGPGQGLAGVGLADRRQKISQGRAAESKRARAKRGPADLASIHPAALPPVPTSRDDR